MESQNKKIKKAAMWVKQTKNGNAYYSVNVKLADGTEEWVNLFYNTKSKPTHPDYKTIEEKPQETKDTGEIPF